MPFRKASYCLSLPYSNDITNTCFSAAFDKAERLGEASPVGLKTTLCMLLTWGRVNDREDTEGKRDNETKIWKIYVYFYIS